MPAVPGYILPDNIHGSGVLLVGTNAGSILELDLNAEDEESFQPLCMLEVNDAVCLGCYMCDVGEIPTQLSSQCRHHLAERQPLRRIHLSQFLQLLLLTATFAYMTQQPTAWREVSN